MHIHDNEIISNFKLLLIGDSCVGKSSLLMRYTSDSFENQLSATIGVDFKVKIVTVPNGSRIKLSIWDTAGQERFRTLTPNVYRGSHGAVFVFDVTNRDSFEHLPSWIKELQAYADYPDIITLLVGNKIDHDQREISREEGLRFARANNMPYIEASAKTSEGVNQLFMEIVTRIYNNHSIQSYNKNKSILQNTNHTNTISTNRIQLNSLTNNKQHSTCCN